MGAAAGEGEGAELAEGDVERAEVDTERLQLVVHLVDPFLMVGLGSCLLLGGMLVGRLAISLTRRLSIAAGISR